MKGLVLAPTQPTQSNPADPIQPTNPSLPLPSPPPQINFDQYFQLIGRMLVASQDGDLANYMVILVALQVRWNFRWMSVEDPDDADSQVT